MVAIAGIQALAIVAVFLLAANGEVRGIYAVVGLLAISMLVTGGVTWLMVSAGMRRLESMAVADQRLITDDHESRDELRERADKLILLQELAATISQTLDLQQVLDTSLKQAMSAIGWDAGAIYLLDERMDTYDIVSFVGFSDDYVGESFSYKLGEGAVGSVAQSDRITITENGAKEKGGNEIATQINIPLTATEHVLGVLNLSSTFLRSPGERQIELLRTIGHQIAVAIEKAQLHSDLASHAQELEGVVKARTAELDQAIEELSAALERAQEADKVKSQLLSTVSHELRTPLATIKGHTSMLVDHHQSVSAETLKQSLTDIEEESDKLAELIDSLLEMSRIEAGVLHVEPQAINLWEVVRNTVEAAQLRMARHSLKVVKAPDGLKTAMADARRVEQILDNLLNNAAMYSEADSPIVVDIEQRSDCSVVNVRDEGHGILAEDLVNIFDRFYRVGSDTDRSRGIGLGLAICKGLVEAQGGRIWVTSEPGVGSRFSFSLPYSRIDLAGRP